MPISRRRLLGASSLLSCTTLPPVWAQPAPVGAGAGGRLVVVFLRGAYDGLSALVPYADPDYDALRPSIAIAAPDGTRDTALRLNHQWALHPALAPLLPLWQQGILTALPCVGLPKPNRSHFDAQYLMETALPEKSSSPVGWLGKLADQTRSASLGVGEANPAILAGASSVKFIPRGEQATRMGVLANERPRSALMDLYAGNDALAQAFRQGAESRMQTSQELMGQRSMSMQQRTLDRDGTPANSTAQQAQMNAASNGAADPVGLALDAQHLATLMRNDRALRLGFLSAGGWDTHANQGNVSGQLANNLGSLARGLAQLRAEFDRQGDLILVMSEFGRTAAENGTRGTDHGYGNAVWLIGNRVQGGQIHGQWSGLGRGQLHEGRDLPVHHDYRALLAQIFSKLFAVSDSQLQSLLPGSTWDQRIDSVIRKV